MQEQVAIAAKEEPIPEKSVAAEEQDAGQEEVVTPHKRQGHPNVYTQEGKAELVARTAELRKTGISIRQIAEKLQIPIGTISHLTWEYQIKGDGTVGGKGEAA